MSKHLNPLEKEFLIRQYKSNYRIKMSDFCEANHISSGAFQKWIKQYIPLNERFRNVRGSDTPFHVFTFQSTRHSATLIISHFRLNSYQNLEI